MARPNTEFRSALRHDQIKARKLGRKAVRKQAIKDRGTREFVPWTWVRAVKRPEKRA